MFRTLSAPINLQIEMTEKCTHRCRHCYNFFRYKDAPYHSLNRTDLQFLTDEISKNKISRIVITGGEPLMEPDNVVWFAEKLSHFPWLATSLNSNLVLFTEDLGIELFQVGVRSILTSVVADEPELHDRITQHRGSWDKTTKAIILAKKLGYRVMVNMVLTKWNIGRVYQTGKLAASLGADKFGATRACAPTPIAGTFGDNLISVDELRKSLEILYNLREECGYSVDIFEHYPWCALGDVEKYQHLARRKCSAGVTSASVGSDGQLRPCGHSLRKYGSVLTDGLSSVWARMLDWRHQEYVGVCKECKYLKYCSGGCAVEAENSGQWKDHHCVGEAGVTRLPQRVAMKISVALDESLSIPNHAGLRKESFGGILFSGNGGLVLLNEKSFEILGKLVDKSSFTARQVIELAGLEESKTLQTLSVCVGKNLIKKGGE